jgi:hypothetical protein
MTIADHPLHWPRLAPWVMYFAAQYLARTSPCQRFTLALTSDGA